MKNLKKRLKEGDALHGCWLNLGSSITAEIVGNAGFDWVLIDLEHGAGDEKDAFSQIQALEHTSAATIVRVESFERQRIHRILDMGVEGIMCPHINNADEAKEVADGLHYPPIGKRGVAKMVRATGFGEKFSDYYEQATENILGVIQIETKEALIHLDEIAAIDYIDVLFIGPGDLSMDMGIYGQFKHPLFLKAIQSIIDASKKAGKTTGILLFNPDDYCTFYDMGIRFIACGADMTFVASGSKLMANKLMSNKLKYKS